MVQIVLKMHSIEGGLFHRAKMHSKWGGNFHGSNRAKNALSWGGTFHCAKNALDWGGTFHVSNRAKNALILKCPWRGRCRVLSKIIKNIFSSKLIILLSNYLASFRSSLSLCCCLFSSILLLIQKLLYFVPFSHSVPCNGRSFHFVQQWKGASRHGKKLICFCIIWMLYFVFCSLNTALRNFPRTIWVRGAITWTLSEIV